MKNIKQFYIRSVLDKKKINSNKK